MRLNYVSIVGLVLACLLSPSSIRAQYLEVGVHAGGMSYSGDLSPGKVGFFLEDVNPAGGAYLRYRPVNRLGFRLNATFGRISADARKKIRISPDEFNVIDRNFRSKINEVAALGELDLFYLGDQHANFVAPYILGGIGLVSFNPQAQVDGIYYDLQPLRTEAQGFDNNLYDPAPYDLLVPTFLLGGGIRTRVGGRFVVGLEIIGRIPNTDYLDDITGRRVRYLDVLENPAGGGSLSARLSNPAVDNAAAAENLSYIRGGDFNDYYTMVSLTVGVTIGKSSGSSRGKQGCYKF